MDNWTKPQIEWEQRVRKRKSYGFWSELYDWIEERPRATTEILDKIYWIMDSHRAFGSEQKAGWSNESLNLVYEDEE